ncbi:MAG: hypothetical protein ABR913_03815 [Sedimentisphaerales bacterium]
MLCKTWFCSRIVSYEPVNLNRYFMDFVFVLFNNVSHSCLSFFGSD